MARKRKVTESKTSKSTVEKKSSNIELDIVINKSYVLNNPLKNIRTNIIIKLNNEIIDNSIEVIKKEYFGITVTTKGNNIIIFTGKHSLSKNDKIIKGYLLLQISEI